jgi:secreted trypsin-like serine protease
MRKLNFAMHTIRAVLLLVISATSSSADEARTFPAKPKIIGGKEALPGQFPWFVSIGYSDAPNSLGHICGGTLISRSWIVTAAHCFKNEGAKPSSYRVQIGVVRLTSFETALELGKVLIHKDFTGNVTDGADIALLKLKTEHLALDKFPALADEQKMKEIKSEESLAEYVVLGFGELEAGLGSSKLMYGAPVPSLGTKSCMAMTYPGTGELVYGDKVKSDMVCAGDTTKPNVSDACKGDSGGGLMYMGETPSSNQTLVGVTSWGGDDANLRPSCSGNALRVGVYTRVATYLSDISDCISGAPQCNFEDQ